MGYLKGSSFTMTKRLMFVFSLLFATGSLHAQTPVWQPSPGHVQVAIWPGTPPDAAAVTQTGPETMKVYTDKDDLIAGKPTIGIRNVSRPTMTVYSPKGKNTGVAVVV